MNRLTSYLLAITVVVLFAGLLFHLGMFTAQHLCLEAILEGRGGIDFFFDIPYMVCR